MAPTRKEVALKSLAFLLEAAQVGIHEDLGENRSEQIDKYEAIFGFKGAPWCDMVQGFYDLKAYSTLLGDVLTSENIVSTLISHRQAFEAAYWPLSASTGTSVQAAKGRGIWVSKNIAPKPGWKVFFDFKAAGKPQHVGAVVSAGNPLHTVEGNTSASGSGSQDNGDGLYLKQRPLSVVLGYLKTY
jgi:hypothetical protein